MLMQGGQDSAKIRAELHKAGFDDRRIEQLAWAIDPIRVAHRLDPDRTWLFSAIFDQVVPAKNSAALGKAAGLDQSHHIWFAGGHYSSVAFLPWVFNRMLTEFRGCVGTEPGSVPTLHDRQ